MMLHTLASWYGEGREGFEARKKRRRRESSLNGRIQMRVRVVAPGDSDGTFYLQSSHYRAMFKLIHLGG